MAELALPFPCRYFTTVGDRDRTTSLRSLGKCDFFTRELDEALLAGEIDAAVHAAKDLPDPLPNGLVLVAVTQGVDPSDALVYNEALRPGALIATSSQRREQAVRELLPDARFCDVRGTIGERLARLDRGEVQGVVVAEAALIRLQINRKRIRLPGETAPLQGRLAVVARAGDRAVAQFFQRYHDPKSGVRI